MAFLSTKTRRDISASRIQRRGMMCVKGLPLANLACSRRFQHPYFSGSPRRTSKSPRLFTPLDSRRIANVVIAKNLNESSQQVQVQALEVGCSQSGSHPESNVIDCCSVDSREKKLYEDRRSRCTTAFPLDCTQFTRNSPAYNSSGILPYLPSIL